MLKCFCQVLGQILFIFSNGQDLQSMQLGLKFVLRIQSKLVEPILCVTPYSIGNFCFGLVVNEISNFCTVFLLDRRR